MGVAAVYQLLPGLSVRKSLTEQTILGESSKRNALKAILMNCNIFSVLGIYYLQYGLNGYLNRYGWGIFECYEKEITP